MERIYDLLFISLFHTIPAELSERRKKGSGERGKEIRREFHLLVLIKQSETKLAENLTAELLLPCLTQLLSVTRLLQMSPSEP